MKKEYFSPEWDLVVISIQTDLLRASVEQYSDFMYDPEEFDGDPQFE